MSPVSLLILGGGTGGNYMKTNYFMYVDLEPEVETDEHKQDEAPKKRYTPELHQQHLEKLANRY